MGLITTLRSEVADRLLADPYFEDIPVLALHPKETISELNNKINRLEIAGTVIIPRMRMTKPNLHGVYFDQIEVQVGFCENRTTNSTGKDVEDVIEKAAVLLHNFVPASLTSPLVLDDGLTIAEVPPETESDRKKRLLALRLVARGGVAYAIPQAETPTIEAAAGMVTLACATAGAAIFYRTDGLHPNPRSGSGSLLYTAPFAAAGVTVKARAWLAGYQASDLAEEAV